MSLSAVPPPGSIASPAISESGPSKSASLVAPQYSPQLARNHKAVASSSSASPPLSSPSFPTSSSRSNATGSQLGPRTPTTASTSVNTHPVLHPNLPSPLSPEQTAQARAALVGTISNLLDSELQSRASLLHSNAAALEKQEREVAKVCQPILSKAFLSKLRVIHYRFSVSLPRGSV